MDYEEDETPFYQLPEWADVVPIKQDDGPNPLVPIAYTTEYSTTLDYFRAMCEKKEMSERALELTKIVIDLSPAHYTVWHYRQQLLEALNSDLAIELDWIQELAAEHPKSYQIWHHRQVIIERLGTPYLKDCQTNPTSQTKIQKLVDHELEFIQQSMETETKNYHAWSYRQWVLTFFGEGDWWVKELDVVEDFLQKDIRNNSAWNQRFFVITKSPMNKGFNDGTVSKQVVEKEIEYVKNKIERTPSNESPWVYLLGLLKVPVVDENGTGVATKSSLKDSLLTFCEGLLDLTRASFSPFLHSTLLDIYEEQIKEDLAHKEEWVKKAQETATLLAEKLDPIRCKYWNWRKSRLE